MIKKLKIALFYIFTFLLVITSTAGVINALPPVERIVLPNNLVLLVSEDHSLPLVIIDLLIDSGSRRDPSGKEGLANLTASGLLLGTKKHANTALNEELDFMGAILDTSCVRDFSTLKLEILKKDLDKGFDIFMETLTQPVFPEDDIQKEVQKILANIQSSEEKPMEVAEKAFRRTLFLNPYSHPVEGLRESLPHIARQDVVQFYRTYYHPNNAILSVVGDITLDEVKTKLVPHLIRWSKSEVPKENFVVKFSEGEKIVKINRDITQANIIFGQAGISRSDPDYYALAVMNYILGGGGFASRLMEEIRNKRGLAYSVGSFVDAAKYPGSFQILLQTKNPSAQEALSLVLQQVKKIQEEPVSEKELEGAKRYLVGSFPMKIDTYGKLADFLVQIEYYGLGAGYFEKYRSLIDAVTAGDVQRVARKYLHSDMNILIIVANLKEAGMD